MHLALLLTIAALLPRIVINRSIQPQQLDDRLLAPDSIGTEGIKPISGQCPSHLSYFSKHKRDIQGQFFQEGYLFKHLFRGVCNKTFVEIGAYDGKLASNTYFFSRHMGWRGILVEANPNMLPKLQHNRPHDIIYNAAISSDAAVMSMRFIVDNKIPALSGAEGHVATQRLAKDSITVAVKALRFADIFAYNNITRVELFSLDVEGAELEVLKSIDFDAVVICVFVVEDNIIWKDGKPSVPTFGMDGAAGRLDLEEQMRKRREVHHMLLSKGYQGGIPREVDSYWTHPSCPEYKLPTRA